MTELQLSGNRQYTERKTAIENNTTTRKRSTLFLLCFFAGVFGFHRFYAGKIGTGFIYLFTAGLFGIGALADAILILAGGFKDINGVVVKEW